MLRDNGRRYEMDEAERTSYADYRLRDGRLFIDYVFSPPELRGTGAAGRLMQAVSEQARAKGLTVTPICGYAASWYDKHDEFADLLG